VTMHDGSQLRLRKLEEDYDPTSKLNAIKRMAEAKENNEILTGVFYVNPKAPTFLDMIDMTEDSLATLPQERIRPNREALEQIMEELR